MRKSMTFNGMRKPWLYLLEGRQKSPFPPVRNNLIRVTGMAGAHVSSKEKDVIYIQQPIGFIADTDEEFLQKKDELAKWLNTNEAVPLQFDDEPGRTYYAEIDGTIDDFTRFSNQRRGIITFLCADPYGYGHEKTLHFPSDQVVVSNEGTAEADPIFELTATQKTTFAMVSNGDDEYNLVGRPADVIEDVVDTRTLVLEERGQTLNSWTTAGTSVDGGVVAGNLGTDNDGITVPSYGPDTPNWHGPALMKEVTPIQDFGVEMMLEGEALANMTYRIEFYLFDENMNSLGKMAIKDQALGMSRKDAEGRIGPFLGRGENYLISSQNYSHRWPFFFGMLRMRRIGKQFEFYVTRVANNTNHVYSLKETFNDINNEYAGRLKFVQIHIGKYGDTQRANAPKIHHIKVTELSQALEDQTPYILGVGDVVTFDHKNEDILVNGEVRPDLFTAMGADFFKLKEGYNNLVVTPANSFATKMKYRERFR